MKKGKKKDEPVAQTTQAKIDELMKRVQDSMDTFQKAIDTAKKSQEGPPMNPQLQVILAHASQIVTDRFPDEIRCPIVGETGSDIGDLGAAIAWYAMRGDYKIAMVFAETLYALGYMAAKEESDPKFRNLD